MNPGFFKVYFMGLFKNLKTDNRNTSKPKAASPKPRLGCPGKVAQATRYHSSLSTSLYLAKQTFTFQIHLPPTTWYHGVEKRGGRGVHEGRRVGNQEG